MLSITGLLLVGGVALATSSPPTEVLGNEAINYTYDAQGRIIEVKRSGTVNNNVATTFEYDKADNRTRLKTVNSPNPPP